MATVNDDLGLDHEEPRKLYEEAYKLLSLAEKLHELCEAYDRRLLLVMVTGLTMILVAVMACYPLAFLPFSGSYYVSLAVAPVVAIVGIGCLVLILEKLGQQLRRERRALHSIVDILREVEKGVAERNNLSALERAEFRIRLSRFDIGPGLPRG